MKLTREDFDRVIEKKKSDIDENAKRGAFFGKLTPIVIIAAVVLISLLPVDGFMKAVLCVFSPVLIILGIFAAALGSALRQSFKALSPCVLKKFHFGIKYSESLKKFRNDLCSDRILSFAEKLIEREKSSFARLALYSEKLSVHSMRCEHDKAYECLGKMKLENDKSGGKFSDHVYMSELSYYGTIENGAEFVRIFDENREDLKASFKKGSADMCSVAAYLSCYAAFKEDYRQAIEYSELAAEYREKLRELNSSQQALDNRDIYSRSASFGDRAIYYASMGEAETAEVYLEMAKKEADKLSCEIPPILLEDFRQAQTGIETVRKNKAKELALGADECGDN